MREVADAIERAEAMGAGPEQIAILEEAMASGELPFEVYNEAVDRALRCLREVGARVEDRGVTEHLGLPQRSYSVGVEAEESEPVEFLPGATVHRCVAEHSAWVEMIYQVQPSSLELTEAFWEQNRDVIVACLLGQGVDVDGDEPMEELIRISGVAYHRGEAQVNCVFEVTFD